MKWRCVLVVIHVFFIKDYVFAVDNELLQMTDKPDNVGLQHPVEETPQSRVDGSAEPGSQPEASQVQDTEARNGELSHPGPLTQLLLTTTKQSPGLGTEESGQLKPEEDQSGDPLNRDKRTHHRHHFKYRYYVEPDYYFEPAVYVKRVYVRPEVYVKPAYVKPIIAGGGYAGAFSYSASASASASAGASAGFAY